MYKAVFIDIDGTLVDNKNNVSLETKVAIKKAMDCGIEVILCSGRCRRDLQDLREVCLASQYIISANGAEIYDCKTRRSFISMCFGDRDLSRVVGNSNSKKYVN